MFSADRFRCFLSPLLRLINRFVFMRWGVQVPANAMVSVFALGFLLCFFFCMCCLCFGLRVVFVVARCVFLSRPLHLLFVVLVFLFWFVLFWFVS